MERSQRSLSEATPSQGRKLSLTLQSKLSALKRSGRRKDSAEEDQVETPPAIGPQLQTDEASQDQSKRLGELFFGLPVELQSHIILFTDISTTLALRETCHALESVVSANVREATQTYIEREIPRSCIKLCRNKTRNLRFLYHLRHAHTTSIHLAQQLESFVEEEYLRSIHTRKWKQMDRSRFVSRATPLLLYLSYYYNTLRLWLLQYYRKTYSPINKSNGWVVTEDIPTTGQYRPLTFDNKKVDTSDIFCSTEALEDFRESEPDLVPFPRRLMRRCFTTNQLLRVDSMQRFLSTAVDRELRPPSYATHFELRVRGWDARSTGHTRAGLLTFGGLDMARRIFSIKSHSDRCSEVDRWYKSLQKSESVHWRKNWNTAVGGPFEAEKLTIRKPEAPESLDFDPPEYFMVVGFNFWTKHAMDILVEEKRWDERKTPRFFVSHLLGYDVLAGTRWAAALQSNDNFDEYSDNEDEQFD